MISTVPLLDDLRDAVRADGRSQRELARLIDIHEVTFSNFMKDKATLAGDKIEKLIAVLGVPVSVGAAKRKGGKRPNPPSLPASTSSPAVSSSSTRRCSRSTMASWSSAASTIPAGR